MKPIHFLVVAGLSLGTHVQSQEDMEKAALREDSADPPESSVARILGKIPDGSPPPPAPPKPEYRVASEDVIETTTHEQGERTITLQQIKPIALPPPPTPVEESTVELDDEFRERLAKYREEHPRAGLLFMGATVYRARDGQSATLVRYWPEGKGGDVTFWSSADFSLIAGGIQSFADSAGHTHQIFMSWGTVDVERVSELRRAKGLSFEPPRIPELPHGKATFKVVGKPATEDALATIGALHEIYNSEYSKLKLAYEGREKARKEREAYLKANPPQPKNITLNYWRVQQPAFNGKGEEAR
ncbi:MAG: hypothetical protein RLZZ245_2778 [Verrucomicrobiota bacterium]